MEEERRLLAADAGVSALVGDRIAWGVAGGQGLQNPCVVLYLIDDLPDYHMLGPSGLASARVQVDCRGTSWTQAKAVGRAVQALLSGFKGTRGNIVFQGVSSGGR